MQPLGYYLRGTVPIRRPRVSRDDSRFRKIPPGTLFWLYYQQRRYVHPSHQCWTFFPTPRRRSCRVNMPLHKMPLETLFWGHYHQRRYDHRSKRCSWGMIAMRRPRYIPGNTPLQERPPGTPVWQHYERCGTPIIRRNATPGQHSLCTPPFFCATGLPGEARVFVRIVGLFFGAIGCISK